MKLLIYTDNHFCKKSSIVKGMGKKYTLRLENQIQSINWVEELGVKKKVDKIICLGDYFDKSSLEAMELGAFNDIKWSNIPKYILVGNHDANDIDLKESVTTLFKIASTFNKEMFNVIDEVTFDQSILWLPYIVEDSRKNILEYTNNIKPNIILSHNDIKGLQMGQFLSQTGFNIEDIENNCNLFINGHLHNGIKFCKNGINLGNLTGQNFSEDAFKYQHNVMILDTKTLEYELIENPFAFNFYKLEINVKEDLNIFNTLKNNSVLSIRCLSTLKEELLKKLETSSIVAYRITYYTPIEDTQDIQYIYNGDYISEHDSFCKNTLKDINSLLLEKELKNIYNK